jgi:dolichyl-phosphate beta-glucosyltransferase
VIPAYNEESRIVPTLEKVHAYCAGRFKRSEIIVVDDGSKDNTASLVKNLGIRLNKIKLIHYPQNAGKGHAVRKGVLSSIGNLLLICDADLSTPIEELEKLITFIHCDYDIAIGSRGLSESNILQRQSWYREAMGKTFNVFVRMFAIRGIKDTQCGFKLLRGDVARALFSTSRIDGFSFDVEVLYLAKKAGYMIKEVPVRWINSPFSRVVLMSDPMKMFLELLLIRFNALTGKYSSLKKS